MPGVKDMSAFASIGNLQKEIEMEEFYDAIIMTPTVFEKSFSKFFMFCVLIFGF